MVVLGLRSELEYVEKPRAREELVEKAPDAPDVDAASYLFDFAHQDLWCSETLRRVERFNFNLRMVVDVES